ncbi:MAG: hypothetical protein IJU23_15090 [Proteobacteria bacterium]|nr:hypothetical protein [Pseudomonadota bacterium]
MKKTSLFLSALLIASGNLAGCESGSESIDHSTCQAGLELCGSICCTVGSCDENDVCHESDNESCGASHEKCGEGQVCTGGKCVATQETCKEGQKQCSGSCVNIKSDPKNCGDCGNKCEDVESCKDGECKQGCGEGYTLIDGHCYNTNIDSEHCGKTLAKCEQNQYCGTDTDDVVKCLCNIGFHDCDGDADNGCESDVECAYACKAGEKSCGANLCCTESESCCGSSCCAEGEFCCGNGVCADLEHDAMNCGTCGNKCGKDHVCKDGECTLQCADTQTECGDACADLKTDSRNCGECGNACKPDEQCVTDDDSTSCKATSEVNPEFSCNTQEELECWGKCVDGQTDANNCGECGKQCNEEQDCKAGLCVKKPSPDDCENPDETRCYGQCVDLMNDDKNCGACLNACTSGTQCKEGKCKRQCNGLTDCNNACVDTNTSNNHCGGCGIQCADGQECVGGACQCAEGRSDCDGLASNGCESTSECSCTPGATQPCWRGDASNLNDPNDLSKGAKGICKVGTQTCDESGQFWSACTGGVYPSALTCDIYGTLNGLDNDCDGKVDTECRSECDLAAGSMSYIGCEYWGAYIDNLIADANSNHTFVFSNPGDTTANVYIFDKAHGTATSVTPYKTVSVGPHDVVAVEMNNRGYNMCKGSGILPNAFRIRSDKPITAYQFSPLGNPDAHSNDASLLLPANVLGKDYIGMTWVSENGNDHRSYIAIIATEPGTTSVTVTTTSKVLATETASIKVNSTTSINTTSITALDKGKTQTYDLPQYHVLTLMAPSSTVVTLPNSPYNQTGTRIHADKNIAVFGGSRSSYVPTQTETSCCRDHIEEQLFPTQAWGKAYYAARAYSTGVAGDFWLITAKEDNTTVTLPDNLIDIQKLNKVPSSKKIGGNIKLNAGETFAAFETKDNFEIHADKPISVGQFLPSQSYNGLSIGDPSFILTVPYEQYRSDYDFMVPTKFQVNYITVITPQDGIIKFDDKTLTPSDYISFKQLGTTDFYVGYYQVQSGIHHMTSNKPFGLYSYGYYNMSSYGYPIGLDLKILYTND